MNPGSLPPEHSDHRFLSGGGSNSGMRTASFPASTPAEARFAGWLRVEAGDWAHNGAPRWGAESRATPSRGGGRKRSCRPADGSIPGGLDEADEKAASCLRFITSGLDPSEVASEDLSRMKKEHGAYEVIQAPADAGRKQELLEALPRLKGCRVLIVGDVGLDEYVLGSVRRISPEAPVPVLEVDAEDQRLGLAANISQNIVRLGGEALTVGVVGRDAGAETLRALFAAQGVPTDHLIDDATRPTTRKMRVMAQHHHLVRVDYEQSRYLSTELEARVLEKTRGLLPDVDLVILQDYAKGVVSQTLTQGLVHLCRQEGKRLLVDPHRSKAADFYSGADLLKPNYDEAVALSGLRFDDLKDNPNKVYEVGRALQGRSGAREVVLTRGKEGMTIFSGQKITEVPTYARRVFDVTGAGDTVIATLSLALAAGLDLVQSCMLANFAAGVVVGKVGSVPCELPELIEYIQSSPD